MLVDEDRIGTDHTRGVVTGCDRHLVAGGAGVKPWSELEGSVRGLDGAVLVCAGLSGLDGARSGWLRQAPG